MGCFSTILLIVTFIFVIVTLIRWFEQVTEAVDNRWWNQVFVLLAMPFTVWLFPSRTSAGRPTPVPHHEPVLGFGLPKSAPPRRGNAPDSPIPKPPRKSSIDPDKIAKLRQKMREQGMLPPEDE